MIFIVSSTGVLIYKTHCSCTGNEQVGFYIKPETCENNFQVVHAHNPMEKPTEPNENCCHECTPQSHDCGCNEPVITFFKLMNEISNEEVSFLTPPIVKIADIILTVTADLEEPIECTEIIGSDTYPPPKIKSSKNFLILINQLKIPFSA